MHDGTLRRILYVEDDADIRKIVSMSLEMVGDYAVLDVMMPDVDGPATLRTLRKRESAADVPAVFITAKVQAGDIERYKRLGVCDVIVKPFDPMLLSDRIGQIWQDYRSGEHVDAG
jgi:two-component system OmpR family response regulator